jgi:uncharacterized tellurite resistance protein B-like protein
MLPNIDVFVRARDELCDRIVSARTARFRRQIKGADFHDDSSMIDADLALPDAPPMIFHLIYTDAKNDLTGRGFKLMRLGQSGNDVTVGGVCFLRHSYRQFKASRIVEVTDLNTGEVFEDGVEFFARHPILGPGDGRMPSEEERAIKSVRDEIVVLTFVAASDGEVHPKEMEAIVTFVFNSWDASLDETKIAVRVQAFVPDSAAFLRAMDRICAKPGRARTLLVALRAVIDADHKIHENERAFAEYVLNRLEAVGKAS